MCYSRSRQATCIATITLSIHYQLQKQRRHTCMTAFIYFIYVHRSPMYLWYDFNKFVVIFGDIQQSGKKVDNFEESCNQLMQEEKNYLILTTSPDFAIIENFTKITRILIFRFFFCPYVFDCYSNKSLQMLVLVRLKKRLCLQNTF